MNCRFAAWGTSLTILLASSAIACSNGPIKEFLLFGNSYFDTGAGNAVATAESLPLPSPTPPFFVDRHSNGPIWIDFTSHALRTPFENYAVAGAETGTGNFFELGLGGLFQQLQRFSEQQSKIKSNTVVIVDGGGNDYFGLLNNPSDLNPAGVVAATEQAILNLSQVFTELQSFGAKKIVMWNLGDMGRLPLFTDPSLGLTALAPLYTAASNAFNGALLELIQAYNYYSKDKQQIFVFDAFDTFNLITAQMIADGVDPTEHTITTFPDGGYAVTGPQPDHVEFYDQVHPTSMTWKSFSNYTSAFFDALINGPRFIAAEQDLVFETSGAHRDAVDNHFRTLHAQRYIYGNNWTDCCFYNMNRIQFYADLNAKWGCTSSRDTAFGLDYNTQLGLLGLDYCWNSSTTIGCSFTAQTSRARVNQCAGHMRLNDFIPTLYAFVGKENYFIDLSTSYHFLNFRRIHRNIPFLEDMQAKGHMDGQAFESTMQLGYVSQCSSTTFIPIIGLAFENICIRPYKERGAGFVNLKMRRQHQNSLISRVGAQFFYDGWAGCLMPFGEIYYEYEFLRNRHTIGPRLYQSNDNSIDYARVGCGRRNFLKYAFGVDAVLTECLSSNLSYEGETTFKECANAIRLELNATF